MARGLRDVAVRDPITRNSADLSPQLRDLLGNIQVGRLTPPEVTAQGLQMFAVCNKKESATDSPQKARNARAIVCQTLRIRIEKVSRTRSAKRR